MWSQLIQRTRPRGSTAGEVTGKVSQSLPNLHRQLQKDLRELHKAIEAGLMPGYSALTVRDDNVQRWSVRLHLDEGSLAEDLKTYGSLHGQDYLQLNIDFHDEHPRRPPLVWVQSPRLEYRTGFVSRGAVCMEALVTTGGPGGWQPSFTMEGVLTMLRCNFQDPRAKGSIRDIGRASSYQVDEAAQGLKRAQHLHQDGKYVDRMEAPKVEEGAPGELFPKRFEELTLTRALHGSTAPQLMRNPAGQRFVAKFDPAHASGLVDNEFHVGKAYEALGIKVPPTRMYDTARGRCMVSLFVEGAELGSLTGEPREQAENKVRQGFVADALLGAWDVVGARGDNIIVDKHGEPWRIDNGCGYKRRARGGKKTAEQFGADVGELVTLRTVNDHFSQVRHRIFSKITDTDVRAQRDAMQNRKEALLEVVPPEYRSTMRQRWDTLMRW